MREAVVGKRDRANYGKEQGMSFRNVSPCSFLKYAWEDRRKRFMVPHVHVIPCVLLYVTAMYLASEGPLGCENTRMLG